MKSIIVIVLIFLCLTVSVSALNNLEFRLDVPQKGYYPNEKIPLNISLINRDTYTAKNISIILNAGNRTYSYDVGDLKPSEQFQKQIMLPEFPAGTHTITGEANYTGLLDEQFTALTYGSFEVLFPPIQRYPRNIYSYNYELSDKLLAGKTYTVKFDIKNDGSADANLFVEFGSMDEYSSETIQLNNGDSKTITMSVNFNNSGISIVEVRIYALIDGQKYLLNYNGKKTYIQEERLANISVDKVEFTKKSNTLFSKDKTGLKIYLKNSGSPATDVAGELSSGDSKIVISKNNVTYGVVTKEAYSPSNDYFEITTNNADIGANNLNLKISYVDSENREKTIQIPITISEGSNQCSSNNDCEDTQICDNNQCSELSCNCGYASNNKCIKYQCCADTDCSEDLTCNVNAHTCEISSNYTRDVLIVTVGSKLDKTDKYYSAINNYRTQLQLEGLSSMYLELDSPKIKTLFNVELTNAEDSTSIKSVLDKIIYKTGAKYLVILGGVTIIPQPLARTSAEIPQIPVSDDVYADVTLDGIPDIAVGRIPTLPNDKSTDTIVTVLNSAVKMHNKHTLSKIIIADTCLFPPSCSGINDVNLISQVFFSQDCSNTERCKSAPPYCTDIKCGSKQGFYDELLNNDIIQLDAHGSPWEFQAQNNNGVYAVFTSSSLYKNKFNTNPLFTTIACHGGTIDCAESGCIGKEGSVFSFMNNGASVYLGNTRYGIGGLSAGILGDFYNNLKTERTGDALLKAKRKALSNSNSDFYNAVIYEMQLYGDPTIQINMGG